jgi:hypothetical protein
MSSSNTSHIIETVAQGIWTITDGTEDVIYVKTAGNSRRWITWPTLNIYMNRLQEVLAKPCLICGKENRFHRVFWSPNTNGYQRQMIDDAWLERDGIKLVPSADHYACIDNLEYLEWKDAQRKTL